MAKELEGKTDEHLLKKGIFFHLMLLDFGLNARQTLPVGDIIFGGITRRAVLVTAV